MRTCPWCGRENLNVYAYCQGCGRGFAPPAESGENRPRRRLWPFGGRKAV